jgi:hypothetical protein
MHSKKWAGGLRKVYQYYGELMSFYLFLFYRKWCKKIIKLNKIGNKKVINEELYNKKWKQLSVLVNVDYYRIFSNYIGTNVNIVPEDISHNIIEHILNPTQYRSFYEDKNMFDKILSSHLLPQTYVRKLNGFYYNSVYCKINIQDTSSLIRYLNNLDSFLIKPTVNSSSGNNIQIFRKINNEFVNLKDKNILDFEYLQDNFSNDFIIQEKLNQHDFFANLNSTSINTIRLLTYRSVINDQVGVPSAILRIGGQGALVDNAHAGGVFIGIDKSGKLGDFACDQFGKKYFSHNGTNFNNNQLIIPNFQNIINFAKTVAQDVPHHRLLALDVVMTSDGSLKLIEFNINSLSTWLFQFTVSSAFEEYTDEIIDYCKKNKHKIEKVRVSVW